MNKSNGYSEPYGVTDENITDCSRADCRRVSPYQKIVAFNLLSMVLNLFFQKYNRRIFACEENLFIPPAHDTEIKRVALILQKACYTALLPHLTLRDPCVYSKNPPNKWSPQGQNRNQKSTGESAMAKAATKSQIIAKMAEDADISKVQAKAALESLIAQAYKGANDGFTIPGLGKLVKVRRKARMGRNPATGEQIEIAEKTVLKFRIAKAAKDAILG
jgi:DNA-binding protein HU-beta